MGVVAFCLDIFVGRKSLHRRLVARALGVNIVLPAVIFALTSWFAAHSGGIVVNIALSLLTVAVIGLFFYRIAFQPISRRPRCCAA